MIAPYPMDTAPKDGTIVRLLVRFTDGAFDDVEPGTATWTIGQNGADHHPEDDEWLFAGWNWEQDRFTQGEGEPIGWLPLHGELSSGPPSEVVGDDDWHLRGYLYASKQGTICAGCGHYKHTPLRRDEMGGYVCLTCIDKRLEELENVPATTPDPATPDGDDTRIAKLQAFKNYVHQRLDEAGIPTHPEGPHSEAGCRVGDRLDMALFRLNEGGSQELQRLRDLLNTPELCDFAKGAVLEAAHQRERWGNDHDAGKEPADWFWLLGYLAGKALKAHNDGDIEKALHHTISSAAALANWHGAILGTTNMRPGIDGEAALAAAPGSAVGDRS